MTRFDETIVDVKISNVTLEKIRYHFQQRFDNFALHEAGVEFCADHFARGVVAHFEAAFWGRKEPETHVTRREVTETENVPAGWLDALRLRFAPHLFSARWPIQYREIETRVTYIEQTTQATKVCPHLSVRSEHPRMTFALYDSPRRSPAYDKEECLRWLAKLDGTEADTAVV